MDERGFSVGWFGIPGGPVSKNTKVHIVYSSKPLCGCNLREEMEYQWCAPDLSLDYVDCKACLNTRIAKAERIAQEERMFGMRKR